MKSFALALGAGGARGLAHIVIVEALEEMGIAPVAIAGSSIGAVIGAGYAAGLKARAMRRSLLTMAHSPSEVMRRVMSARATGWTDILGAGFGNPFVVDAGKFYDTLLGDLLPKNFSDLTIPLTVLATDLHAREAIVYSEGALKPAVSASMAVPGLVQPVDVDGRTLVDGGVTDPLPFGCLRGKADVIVAVDVSAGGEERGSMLDPWNNLMATITVMGHTIVQHKLKEGAPDLVVQPNVGVFRMLDFFQASAILRAAEPIKAEVKEKLGALLSA
jgi:NTE family protein